MKGKRDNNYRFLTNQIKIVRSSLSNPRYIKDSEKLSQLEKSLKILLMARSEIKKESENEVYTDILENTALALKAFDYDFKKLSEALDKDELLKDLKRGSK